MPRRYCVCSLLGLFLLLSFLCVPGQAWDLPDKVWVNRSMPPVYWQKTGSLAQQSDCSLQRYDLYRPGGMKQDTFRMAVVCPKEERFCTELLPDNQQPSGLPLDCSFLVPDTAVKLSIMSHLYNSAY